MWGFQQTDSYLLYSALLSSLLSALCSALLSSLLFLLETSAFCISLLFSLQGFIKKTGLSLSLHSSHFLCFLLNPHKPNHRKAINPKYLVGGALAAIGLYVGKKGIDGPTFDESVDLTGQTIVITGSYFCCFFPLPAFSLSHFTHSLHFTCTTFVS